ncbi:MAG: alanine--tRNA ligase [Anaerolineaceae bacterium]|nr:alanine--tRNA ligase [Anaerolineaceae bacterium]
MHRMTSAQVRQAFLDFFEAKGHRIVPSSSLVPHNDPTLLFANAGMNQFKDVFLGKEKRDYTRATTAQKVMRVSGKHNDLEEVGPSKRHHTFFEMMGNFSFGDYFKVDAIKYAWELITEVYGLPPDRLGVTIYEKDDESFQIWADEIGVDPKRIGRLGPKDNFWQMAETGPCGPNTEIHFDRYPERGIDNIIPSFEADDGRFLEFWNLVFMQFNRTQPDPLHTGEFDEPLPAPGVDTGLGLERMVTILQGCDANYETDLFMPMIETTQRLAGKTDTERDENIVPYRVIADHARAAAFMIGDGVLPGAKGRDSICRLVIRRAARFGQKLGLNEPFLADVAQATIDVMGHHYKALEERRDLILETITLEEKRFLRTMERGIDELEGMLNELPEGGQLGGDDAFYLKATLGLPIQVTQDIAKEMGYKVDMAGFNKAEEEHSLVSGGGQAMGVIESGELYADALANLTESGKLANDGVDYQPYNPEPKQAEVVAVLQDGQPIENAIIGDKVEIVLNTTPFYVESGGQVSDVGTLQADGWTVDVEGMKQPVKGLIVHVGEIVEGSPKVGDTVTAIVDYDRREDIIRNHTGTHLLHAALRNHLGKHVEQRGSLVAPDRLRFDFSHNDKLTPEEMSVIEQEVNDIILANYPVRTERKSLDEARSEGAMALFGEKYADVVRTVIIDNGNDRYSYELCGGAHVGETAEIGAFILTSEGSVSAGVRRIEAVTGKAAAELVRSKILQLDHIAATLNTTPDNTLARIEALQDELTTARKQVNQLQRRLAKYDFDEMLANTETIGGKSVLIGQLEGVPVETMREMADWFRNKTKENGVLVLGSNIHDKPMILVMVTDDLVKQGLKAGDLIKPIAAEVGGGGGGRPNMAQAGGKDASRLPQALQKARDLLA